jgi:putative sigma-54 modulation protein
MTRAEGILGTGGEVGESEEERETKLVETRKVVLKPMSLEDAVMEMDVSKQRFIIYRDSSSESVSLIYRRDDGNYTLIEASH